MRDDVDFVKKDDSDEKEKGEARVWEEQKKVKNEKWKRRQNFLSMEKLQKVTKNSSSVWTTNTTEEERTTSFHNNNNNECV